MFKNNPFDSSSVDVQLLSETITNSINLSSLKAIKNIIKESYRVYSKNCFGSDFVFPLTGECISHSGIAITAVDSLDTLILIDDNEDVEQINDYLISQNSFCKPTSSFIHTNDLITHVIGGLISAYSLTSNNLYLKKALECADFSLSAFSNVIPNPLINEKHSEEFKWAKGTSLSESSGFPIEFSSLSCLSKNKKYTNKVKSYFDCISKKIIENNKLFIYWSTEKCENSFDKHGISPLTTNFLANTLRSHIYSPTNETEKILNWFESKYEQLNLKEIAITDDSLDPRFDTSLCQILPLLKVYNQQKFSRLIKKLNSKCRFMSKNGLPAISAQMKKNFLEIDQNGFDFESSLLEDLIVNGEMKEFNEDILTDSLNVTINRIRCKKALCGLLSSEPDVFHNFMPSLALSKWAKYLLFNKGAFKYDTFLFNEAGHVIPKC